MAIRIQDIATELNLSPMTVSRVLNRPKGVYIAPETNERVLEAAARMGYRPNRHARALATGRTNTIAIWISHLESSVYTQIAKALREEVETAGLQASISELHWHFKSAASQKRVEWQVDGILAVDPPEPDHISVLLGEDGLQGIPRVYLGSGLEVEWQGDYVRVDLGEGTRVAVSHLARAGCRRIAYAVPRLSNRSGHANYDAYVEAIAKAGLKTEFIEHDGWDMASVRTRMREYLASHGKPDGLYCHNDEIAIASYRALRDLKLSIPEDVLIIGCEGNEFMEYFDPALSTISMPIKQMCRTAWELMQQRLAAPETPTRGIVLQHQFFQRESS